TLNLFTRDLPAVAGENIETRYGLSAGSPIDPDHEESWKQIEELINDFIDSDLVVISPPMWNFSIPYVLKYYIDCIVQPGYAFQYDENGDVHGLFAGKRVVVITSRGGDYSPDPPMHSFDYQEPYLRKVFAFTGITDI